MRYHLFRVGAILALALAFNSLSALAEEVAAKEVNGVVNDSLGKPLTEATVSLKAADERVVGTTHTDDQGRFNFPGVNPGTYSISVDKPTFQTGIASVTVTPEASATTTITLASSKPLEIQVIAQRLDQARNGISVDTGSSVYRMGTKDLEALPLGDSTSFNQVMLQTPGVAQDSYGQLHVRGDHANLQYRINGIILPESITGFGQTLDTRFAENVNFLTGALPAQYGYRTAGIVDIQTKTGAFAEGGNVGVLGGSRDTKEVNGEVSGNKDALSYYFTGAYHKDNLGIENPTDSLNALHDTTTQSKGFGYLSYVLDESSRISVILGTADNRFQIPDVPGQTPGFTLAGVSNYPSTSINDNQHEQNRYEMVAFQGTSGADVNYQIAAFNRLSKVMYDPDNTGDLLYTGVASTVGRTSNDNGLQGDGSYQLNDTHTLRSGVVYSQERSKNSDNSLTFPADANGNQLSNQPFTISDNNRKTSSLYGAYLQDEWKATEKLTVNYGARADWVNAYVAANQFSPRLGAVYQATPQTTWHAAYAKYFTPPPTELVATTTVAAFQSTTNAPPSSQNDPVKAESSDYYDAGVSHRLTPSLTLGFDGYYRKVKNLIDEGQFGSALLFTPFNYEEGKVYGAEFTANYRQDKLSGYFNIAQSRAMGKNIISSQYNFAPDELAYIANHFIHLDHDQKYSASTGASYLWDDTTYDVDAIYGSGLRSGFANTDHLPSYTQFNVSADHMFHDTQLGKIDGRISIINLFDKSYEIRDGTGVGVGAPQFGPRRAYYASINKVF